VKSCYLETENNTLACRTCRTLLASLSLSLFLSLSLCLSILFLSHPLSVCMGVNFSIFHKYAIKKELAYVHRHRDTAIPVSFQWSFKVRCGWQWVSKTYVHTMHWIAVK